MTSIGKLKDRARKHEQKEDWKAAIDAYRRVLETEAAGDEVERELGLYNRVGDLYLRIGQTDNAVDYYEKAADKYAEFGFFNNAIALCNKALRHRPDRAGVYLKLSRFCREQGFLPDARRWILGYAEREVKQGNADAALAGLQEFAGDTDDPDVRELLAQHLASHGRAPEAVDQLRHAHAEWARRGDETAAGRVAEQARGLDPNVVLDAPARGEHHAATGLPGIDDPESDTPAGIALEPGPSVQADHASIDPGAHGIEGLETHGAEAFEDSDEDDVIGLETTGVDPDRVDGEKGDGWDADNALDDPIEELDELDEPLHAGAGVASIPDAGAIPEIDENEPSPLPLLDSGFDEEGGEEPDALPLLDSQETQDLDERSGVADEVAEELVAEEPVAEEPVAEEPVAEEPVAEEPVAEEPVAEEPVAEEPLAASAPVDEVAGPAEPRRAEEAGPLDLGAGFDVAGAGPAGGRPDAELMDLNLDLGSFGGGTGSGVPEAAPEDLDVEAVLNRSKELVSRGLIEPAFHELALLVGSDAEPAAFRQALAVANEIQRHSPDDLTVMQRRVELADRTGDNALMVGALEDLAAGWTRSGAETRARAMYQRILALDPGNATAREALGDEALPEVDPVDLDAVRRDLPEGELPRSGEPGAPGADEEFAAMLSHFKARVGVGSGGKDAGDHYDLGLAFKEMGLIDEAIAEFRTALTGGEERLKVYEELGQCFILKGQYTIAIKVFKRGLQSTRHEDAEVLGVYYHMGQCHEELGQRAEARAAYEKVLEIDPNFEDVPSRVSRL